MYLPNLKFVALPVDEFGANRKRIMWLPISP